jgi:hypothetical protein
VPILFLGWLFGFIGSLFVKVGEVIFDVMRAVGPWVQEIVGALRSVVDTMAGNIGRFFRWIAGAARALFDHVLSPVVRALQTWFQRFRSFLDRVFAPIVKVFNWINDFLDKVWSKVIAPILDVIDKIRLVFRFLETLGIEWAGAVDRFLQALETRIYDTFRDIRSFVNNVFTWLDLLLDPRGWIKQVPFLWSIFQFSGNVVNLLTKLGLDPLNKDRYKLARQDLEPTELTTTVEKFRAGGFREDWQIKAIAARFRSRRTGTF